MRMSKQIRLWGWASRWSADIPVRLSAQREQACRAKRRRAALVLAASLCLSAIFVTDLTGLAQPAPQSPATSAASRRVALVATQSGAVARPSGRAQQDPVAIKTARSAALIAATADVLKETSELRQLPILHQVQSSTQSRAEIERMLIRNLDEETSPPQIHATELTLKKLGLAPADFQYRALMLRLLTEQVAGYYDPKTREFHLADWIDLDGQKPVMAHELTHALQDQHFNLRRFEHWPKGDSDAELAAHALIEGDATLAMSFYVLRDPLRALAFLKSMGAKGVASEELDKAPRALRESLLFPYQEGLIWTRRLYGEGGWDRVSKAFTELPQSTEQILHPEKYFAHEAPVKVTLPDLTPLLNRRGQRSKSSGQWAVSGEQSAAGSNAGRAGSAGILPAFSGTDIQSVIRGTGVPPVSGYSFSGSAAPLAGSAGILPAFSGTDIQSVIRGTSVPPVSDYSFAERSAVARAGNAGILPAGWLGTDFELPTAHRSLLTNSSPTAHRSLLTNSSPTAHRSLPTVAWRRIDSDVTGEWGFYLILDQFLKSPAESRRAAAGWGGDRSAVYEGPKGKVLFVCLSTWDTENDAREFFDAYVKRTQSRYPGAAPMDPRPNTQSPTSSKTFRTSEGLVVIELQGSRALILEGILDQRSSNTLRKSLWQ